MAFPAGRQGPQAIHKNSAFGEGLFDSQRPLMLKINPVGEEGVEPSWAEAQQILSLSCLPFHHSPKTADTSNSSILIKKIQMLGAHVVTAEALWK